MWDVTKDVGLEWNVTHETVDSADAKWLVEKRSELWKKVAHGYKTWLEAADVLTEVKKALSEKNEQ